MKRLHPTKQVVDFLGSAAFSKAVQAIDMKNGGLVCLKIVKVSSRMPIVLQWSEMQA